MNLKSVFELGYILKLASLLIAIFGAANVWAEQQDELKITRLTWAGVKIEYANASVFIDPVGKDLWAGNAPEGLVSVESNSKINYVLITHSHNDHFDIETLKRLTGEKGYVICHEDIATYIASRGLRVIPVKDFMPLQRGPFIITALPAVDGFGSEQVSWLVSVAGTKVLHAGDTLWHGKWKLFGAQYGPVDVAFLPINGVIPGNSETHAVMTPKQATEVAINMAAKQVVPIHFGSVGRPNYREVKNPLQQFRKHAERRGVNLIHLKPGDVLNLHDRTK